MDAVTYEERCAEHARETAEAKDQKNGQIAFRGVVVWEGNAVSGSILVPGKPLQPPEADSKEKSGVIVPRRR